MWMRIEYGLPILYLVATTFWSAAQTVPSTLQARTFQIKPYVARSMPLVFGLPEEWEINDPFVDRVSSKPIGIEFHGLLTNDPISYGNFLILRMEDAVAKKGLDAVMAQARPEKKGEPDTPGNGTFTVYLDHSEKITVGGESAEIMWLELKEKEKEKSYAYIPRSLPQSTVTVIFIHKQVEFRLNCSYPTEMRAQFRSVLFRILESVNFQKGN